MKYSIMYPIGKLKSLGLLLCLLLLLAACGAAGGGGSGGDGTPNDDPPADTNFICETQGYPCTLGEVTDAVLERSDALLVEAKSKIELGESYEQVLAWIKSHSDVAEAVVDVNGLYFRVEGGVPTWLIEPTVREEVESVLRPQEIVGRDTNRDTDKPKKDALLISPFFWQWGSTKDPTNSLEATLQGIPDYKGGVKKLQNKSEPPAPTDQIPSTGNIKVSDFKGWHEYDIVYVSSHGGRRDIEGEGCEELWGISLEWCLVSVTSGERVKSSSVAKKKYGDNPGIRTTGISGVDGIYLTLTADFFRDEYGLSVLNPGLDKAVVFIDTCNSYYNSTLATSLAGGSSAFFGWGGSVLCTFRTTVTDVVFDLLAKGYTARQAFNKVKKDKVDPPGDVELEMNSSGDDLRILELPELQHPTTGTRLEDGASLQIRGTPGDGTNDALELVVDVTGVIDPDDTGGIGTSQADDPAELYTLKFFADNQEVGASNLGRPPRDRAEVVPLDEVTHRLTYLADLPFDLPEDGKDVALKVEVLLPEGGVSDYEVDVRLVGAGCEFRAVLSGHRNEDITARAVKLTEETDLGLFGTADAYLNDAGALTHIDFAGPLQGRTFNGGFGGQSPAVPGSRLPSIPVGSTGSFDVNGHAWVGPWDNPDGGYTVANVAPVWYDPDWQPLTLTISEFTEEYVTGRISGEVHDFEDESGPEPLVSFIDIEFQALTTRTGSGSRCLTD